MSIRLENCIQYPDYKDKDKKIPKTVNLLLSDKEGNTGFDWKAYIKRYDDKINDIRKDSTLSEIRKQVKLEKLQQQYEDVNKYRQKFVVGHDVFYNEDGIPYDKRQLGKNVFALHLLGHYQYVVKYLHPNDRELQILNRLKRNHIQIQNLIIFDMKYAVEREKKTLKNLASSSQPIATTKGFYIPIVMPHYDGDLTHFMLRKSSNYKRRLNAEEILNVLLTVSNVYVELMVHNLFYTDIKPGNILYREDRNGKIKVVVGDLGGMVNVHHNVKCDFAPQTFPYPHKNYQSIQLYHDYKKKRDAARDEKEIDSVNKFYASERNVYFHAHHSPRGDDDVNYNARQWEFRQIAKMENIVTWGVSVLGMTLFMTHEKDHHQYVQKRREPLIMEQSVRFTRNLEFTSLSYSNPNFYKYQDGVKSIPGYLEFRQQLATSRIFRTMVPNILKDMFWLKVGDMQTARDGFKGALEREKRNNYDRGNYDDRGNYGNDDRGNYGNYDRGNDRGNYGNYDRNGGNYNRRNYDRNGGNYDRNVVRPPPRRKRKRLEKTKSEEDVSPSEQARREARKRRFGGGGLVLQRGKVHFK